MSLLSESTHLINAAAVLGHLFLLGGSVAIISPRSALGAFGLTVPTAPESQRLVDLLIPLYGFREISLGISMVAASRYGSPKTLAQKQSRKMGWIFLGITPVTTALAAGLLGYFD
ncbi:hypothetical protein D6D21_04182 [Aureobasidium pullulans]|uniref:Uncharacterized protein n=1 Tax=Aureobasidium pullulans TaxID=5580 RepID=A0AB74J157_AURPU|nr:hypothetical protein D6D21_04182 [Aureobasidium pullulans]THX77578.1 hypothetical protein D6D04_06241 [Aureobasidium pullulans]